MKRRKYERKFFIKVALCTMVMVSCFTLHCFADAPSNIQDPPTESTNRTESEEHLFLEMPFGSSLEFCSQILEKHFAEVLPLKGADGIYASIMIENPESSKVIGEPNHIDIDFQENQINRINLLYPTFDIAAENNYFDRLMAELTQAYGTSTDAYMVLFGEVPNITYYHFPMNKDRYDMEKAIQIAKEKGNAFALCIMFDNVMLAFRMSDAEQDEFYCSLSYNRADVSRYEDQRVDYK